MPFAGNVFNASLKPKSGPPVIAINQGMLDKEAAQANPQPAYVEKEESPSRIKTSSSTLGFTNLSLEESTKRYAPDDSHH